MTCCLAVSWLPQCRRLMFKGRCPSRPTAALVRQVFVDERWTTQH